MKILKLFFSNLFLGANLCTVLLLWAICLSTYVSPAEHPTLSTMGLLFPVFVFLNVAFVFFWIVFKIRYVWVSLVGLGCVFSFFLDYCPVRFKASEASDGTLKIISFNVGHTSSEEDCQKTIDYLRQANADVICLQEAGSKWESRKDFKKMLESLHYRYRYNSGEYIITRFKFVGDSIPVHFPATSSSGHSFAHLIDCEGDTVLVVNNHLQSNQLSPQDKMEYKSMIKNPQKEKIEKEGGKLIRQLAQASALRCGQTEALCELLHKYEGKGVILCGDFNDTPLSYTYQQFAKRLNCAFRKAGRGIGTTYNEKGFWVRIDHIFFSDDWVARNTYVDRQIITSDHYPIVAHLTKK